MKITYSEPRKLHNGLWETTLSDENGWTVLIVKYTTKKRLLEWIKEDKKQRTGGK